MSGTVEYPMQDDSSAVIRTIRPRVYIDDVLCDYLEPIELEHAAYPHGSRLRLSFNRAACDTPPDLLPEEARRLPGMGASVRLCIAEQDLAASQYPREWCLFEGSVEQTQMDLASDRAEVSVTARDFSADLERRIVYGRRLYDASLGHAFSEQERTVFNENGVPNRSPVPLHHAGGFYPGFAAYGQTPRFWTAAEVIRYLLGEYILHGELAPVEPETLDALTQSAILYNLDLTGKSVYESLGMCASRCGVSFYFEPRNEPAGPARRIVFFRPGAGRTISLNLPRPGQILTAANTDVVSLRSTQTLHPVTNRYIGIGEIKAYEATFDLLPAWDPALQIFPADSYKRSSIDFELVREVFRRWCLNEAGQYADPPYSLGPAYDFAPVFGTETYTRRPRRFYPALTQSEPHRSLGLFLEASFDNGSTWHRYEDSFQNLTAECGIWLSSYSLGPELWEAVYLGTLRFRVTAVVLADERLTAQCADAPLLSCAPVTDHIVSLRREYAYRRVTPLSRFYDYVRDGNRCADEADDTAALNECLRLAAGRGGTVFEKSRLTLARVESAIRPGDCVTFGPDSRDPLALRCDSRSAAWAEKTRIDFIRAQTQLDLLRKRINL